MNLVYANLLNVAQMCHLAESRHCLRFMPLTSVEYKIISNLTSEVR